MAEEEELPELWIYERYGTELIFIDGDLVTWKTDRTREQLRAIPEARK